MIEREGPAAADVPGVGGRARIPGADGLGHRGIADEPAQPPLPTAWNLPFQSAAGSQTSTLMSESLVGLSVAATRQNSGRLA